MAPLNGIRRERLRERLHMNHFKIGVRLESLGPSVRQAIHQAQRLGVRGVQADAIGDLSPETLSQTGRSAFRSLLRSHNLELTALGCSLRWGLDRPQEQQQLIDHTKATLSLSVDLGANIAIVQTGRVPGAADDPGALSETLQAIGRHGDRIGAMLALETGLASGAVLSAFLHRFSFDTASLGVNLDAASLLLHGFDPYDSARALRGKVIHVRATDARRAGSGSIKEMPLGHGDVDWARYLDVLEEIDYRGWLTIERNGGGNRVADVAAGISFLEKFANCPV